MGARSFVKLPCHTPSGVLGVHLGVLLHKSDLPLVHAKAHKITIVALQYRNSLRGVSFASPLRKGSKL